MGLGPTSYYSDSSYLGSLLRDPFVGVQDIGPAQVDHAYFFDDGHAQQCNGLTYGAPRMAPLSTPRGSHKVHFILVD
jgi:hypothetical protein